MDTKEKDFEKAVLRIAKIKFPSAIGGGSEMVDGAERDGIFETRDVVHYIECTVSRSLEKAKKDVNKLDSLHSKLVKKYGKTVSLWFITHDEPTADQRAVANKSQNTVISMSLNSFISTIYDAHKYLMLRDAYIFGNKGSDEFEKINDSYIKINLADIRDREIIENVDTIYSKLVDSEDNFNFVVIGQYGVGKSMLLKELYKKLADKYRKDKINKFPILINLRDHDGQTDPVEVLERHARKIGYPHAHELVQAWRGGFVTLLLDGFDEISTIGWSTRIERLKSIRETSMAVIKAFILETPSDSNIVITGRSNYFASIDELKSAFGLPSKYIILSIDDFDPEQVRMFLDRNNIRANIPEWIPNRPLLLGYLVAKGVLSSLPGSNTDPAFGWNVLLDQISEREARIDAGVSKDSIRQIIERLASLVRKYTSDLGPIEEKDLKSVFEQVTGFEPDDKGLNIIQRLPGLGFSNVDGSRYFVDENFAATAKAGDIARFIVDPFNYDFPDDVTNWGKAQNALGQQVLNYKIVNELKINKGQWETAIERAGRNGFKVIEFDVYQGGKESLNEYTKGRLVFSNISIPQLILNDEINEENIELDNCYIDYLEYDFSQDASKLPVFKECLIETIFGLRKEEQVNDSVFQYCAFGTFERPELTNKNIRQSDFLIQEKVAFTILKKLYIQKGSGRLESALSRGLSQEEKRYVNDVLQVLDKLNYAIPSKSANKKIWLPVKDKFKVIGKVIGATNYDQRLSQELKQL